MIEKSSLLSQFSSFPIGFGGAAISGEGAGYGFGDITKDQSIELLKYAYDRGYRLFDSAPIYGFGESERRIGQAFKSIREKVFIVSKSGVTWAENKRVDMTNDPGVTRKMLEQSLKDLNTEYIDLFMVHWPDEKVDIRRVIEVLAKAKLEGKIKHIGLCNTFKADFEAASSVSKIEVIQSQFNYFEQDAKNELFPLCDEHNVSFMSWGTLDKGIITGRVNKERKFDSSDCRSWAPWWKSIDKESRFKTMEKINLKLNELGHTPVEFALSFNLSHPQISNLLCGARNEGQIDSLIKAYKNRISDKNLELILDSI